MILVTFAGVSTLGASSASTYRIWSYSIQPSKPSDLVVGHRIALALPSDIDVQSPIAYPGIAALVGAFLEHDAAASRQYVGRTILARGKQIISFVAPDGQADRELFLVTQSSGQPWVVTPIATTTSGGGGNVQLLAAPRMASGAPMPVPGASGSATPVFTGRPVGDFAGTLPYASEVFGVYQPLAGWVGYLNSQRVLQQENIPLSATRDVFVGPKAVSLTHPLLRSLTASNPLAEGVLSPVGLINLFREYFFEFDTFLGVPSGHVWISPGGTVEVIEVSTRRTLIEKTAEESVDTTRKVEESLTQQDDIADAVKEDNANDTRLGATVTAGANYAGIVHADASASYSAENTVKKSSEETHKHSRTQSNKVSSEIHRNFKTTFRTVTETTDTTSRRYVVQNTTERLVNYELRRKMRKVGVQIQHIGSRLSWQVFLNDPGRDLGLGELVHVAAAPDLSSIKKPEPPPPLEPKNTSFVGIFPILKIPGTKVDPNSNMNFILHDPGSHDIRDAANEMHISANADFTADPPTAGYSLSQVSLASAKSGGVDVQFVPEQPIKFDPGTNKISVIANALNTGDNHTIQLTFTLTWKPGLDPAQHAYDTELAAYEVQVAELQREAYFNTVRERLGIVSRMRPRPSDDLRSEERQSVYGNLIQRLDFFQDPHLGSELIRQIFDVDEMLYFTAPDYWIPKPVPPVDPSQTTVGRYPITPPPATPPSISGIAAPSPEHTVVTWYTKTDQANAVAPDLTAPAEYRVNYLITEDTQPAPLGSSLGWLIQMDGDARRNEFLNAAWVKAVLPIRPGHEVQALAWLSAADVEGEAGLGNKYPFQPGDPPAYQGKKLSEVLDLLANQLQASNTDINNTLATEKVFETGFDPLQGGFRPATAYEVFDQWIEVLPTDQIAAVEYDPTVHGA